jgi:hypothetical protein
MSTVLEPTLDQSLHKDYGGEDAIDKVVGATGNVINKLSVSDEALL